MNFVFVIMKNITVKYRKNCGIVIFINYLLIITLNIIHIHNYDINTLRAFAVPDISNHHYRDVITEYGCIIHQNFCSLHTLVFSSSISILFNKNDKAP